MSKLAVKLIAPAFILILTAVLFLPVFRGLLPLPLDAMVGSYFPWLDHKFGYSVGVPVKNPAISDVYSQQFPWQSLAADLIRQGQWPLWNPYSFSGYPLLANWQSAPVYPLRLLMVFLGNNPGFTLSVILQVLLSLSFMYLFLRKIKRSVPAALTGAVIFSLSGFMMTQLENNTVGHSLLWVPLALYLIENYLEKRSRWTLPLLSFIVYAILTAGFFQPALYSLMIIFLYGVCRMKTRFFFPLGLFFFLGVTLSAVQLLPTFELLHLSIRNLDQNIVQYLYGLLPVQNLASFLAPDFFGNPATNNFWGFMQYQETSGYFSLISLSVIVWLVAQKKHDFYTKFFTILFFVSLLLAFANPLSRAIYLFKLPLLSTGFASRWLLVTSLSAAILVAIGLDKLNEPRKLAKYVIYTLLALSVCVATVLFCRLILQSDSYVKDSNDIISLLVNLRISLRNSVIPLGLIVLFLLATLLAKRPLFLWLVCFLIVLDLSRYFIKFTPFSPPSFETSDLATFQFLRKNLDFYRLEKEQGPLLPANTWIYQHFQTTGGYDPLVYLPYASFFRLMKGSVPQTSEQLKTDDLTRYLILDSYQSPLLDLAGVKYLLALKHDEVDAYKPTGKKINYKIPTDRFTPVFDDGTVLVLENKTVLPRAKLYDRYVVEPDQFQAQMDSVKTDLTKVIILSKKPGRDLLVTASDSATIKNYQANQVTIETVTRHPTILLLSDTDYPGWEVMVDNEKNEIIKAFGIYRAVEVPAGVHQVRFRYQPKSFIIGLYLSLVSGGLIILLSILVRKYHD